MRLALLAHEQFPERAKTALGILRYADDEVVAVIDRDNAGGQVLDHVRSAQNAPIVASMEDIEEPVDALVIGVAPIGGGFDESWRPDVRTAIERGCDLVSGLHYFLEDDEAIAGLAAEHDVDIWDVRRPPEDLTVAEGIADTVDAEVILTVGTDCSSGKMTTSAELTQAIQDAGHSAAMVPTGQTGIMIEGWGIPIDRVISDFAAGAVEQMLLEKGEEFDYLIVEGQGSIFHPAYSGVTTSILHGAMPDKLVLCHVAGREAIHRYESVVMPSMETYVDIYESLSAPVAATETVAGMLHTGSIETDEAARSAVEEYEDALGLPATDPVRFDVEEVLDAIL